MDDHHRIQLIKRLRPAGGLVKCRIGLREGAPAARRASDGRGKERVQNRASV
jgi:hypothetical protein